MPQKTFISDATLAWQLYLISMRSRNTIVFPAIVLSAGSIGGILVLVVDLQRAIRASTAEVIDNPWSDWNVLWLPTTLLLNCLVTGLIVRALWLADRRLQSVDEGQCRRYSPLIVRIVQSGAIYVVVIGAYLVVYFGGYVSQVSVVVLRCDMLNIISDACGLDYELLDAPYCGTCTNPGLSPAMSDIWRPH